MTAEEAVVVINSGSSSVKFAAFADDEALCPLRSGAVERIGAAAARFRVRDAAGGKLVDEVYAIGDHKERTVVTHLGNGSSMATIRDGRSVETTMGFSTLADLPMGTCCGDMAAFTAALGGLDGVVFTGGIGANAPAVRARICNGLAYLGLRIDPGRNAHNEPCISADDSAVRVETFATDEELMIARHPRALLKTSRPEAEESPDHG